MILEVVGVRGADWRYSVNGRISGRSMSRVGTTSRYQTGSEYIFHGGDCRAWREWYGRDSEAHRRSWLLYDYRPRVKLQ